MSENHASLLKKFKSSTSIGAATTAPSAAAPFTLTVGSRTLLLVLVPVVLAVVPVVAVLSKAVVEVVVEVVDVCFNKGKHSFNLILFFLFKSNISLHISVIMIFELHVYMCIYNIGYSMYSAR